MGVGRLILTRVNFRRSILLRSRVPHDGTPQLKWIAENASSSRLVAVAIAAALLGGDPRMGHGESNDRRQHEGRTCLRNSAPHLSLRQSCSLYFYCVASG